MNAIKMDRTVIYNELGKDWWFRSTVVNWVHYYDFFKKIFTAAVLSGLTFIMMNEGTFRSLSKMQPTDYLLIGKSLFPQAAYIESTSFESNNLPYSSGVTKKKSEKSNATNFILSKIQNTNNETNILEIKLNKN